MDFSKLEKGQSVLLRNGKVLAFSCHTGPRDASIFYNGPKDHQSYTSADGNYHHRQGAGWLYSGELHENDIIEILGDVWIPEPEVEAIPEKKIKVRFENVDPGYISTYFE